MYGHLSNVPTHFNVKLPLISGHLPNADADSHLLVVSTCYNGQCKQMPRFRWLFQPKIAGAQFAQISVLSSGDQRAICHVIEADEPRGCGQLTHSLVTFVSRHQRKSRIMFVQPAMLKNRTILRFGPTDRGAVPCGRSTSCCTRKATVAYVEYKHSRTVGLQYLSC